MCASCSCSIDCILESFRQKVYIRILRIAILKEIVDQMNISQDYDETSMVSFTIKFKLKIKNKKLLFGRRQVQLKPVSCNFLVCLEEVIKFQKRLGGYGYAWSGFSESAAIRFYVIIRFEILKESKNILIKYRFWSWCMVIGDMESNLSFVDWSMNLSSHNWS